MDPPPSPSMIYSPEVFVGPPTIREMGHSNNTPMRRMKKIEDYERPNWTSYQFELFKNEVMHDACGEGKVQTTTDIWSNTHLIVKPATAPRSTRGQEIVHYSYGVYRAHANVDEYMIKRV